MDYLKRVARITGYRLLGLLIFFLLVFLFGSKGLQTSTENMPTPSSTSTPLPAWAINLQTDAATQRAKAGVPESVRQNCALWSNAVANKNIQCVYGIIKKVDIAILVTPTSKDIFDSGFPNDYVYFKEDGNRRSLYLVSSPGTTTYQVGDCVVILGYVEVAYDGILFINGTNKNTKVNYCSEATF